VDDEYAKTPAELEKWRQFCSEMRDSAGQVNAAIHAGDAAAVNTAMRRLQQSCDACHGAFRQQ
jgi:cytochrome c556